MNIQFLHFIYCTCCVLIRPKPVGLSNATVLKRIVILHYVKSINQYSGNQKHQMTQHSLKG